jgi:CO/xanthine dehydrogenase FAD-binding subunit
MIIEYHRPKTIQEALELLARRDIVTVPLGGGTYLNQPSLEPIAAVDIQQIGLNSHRIIGNVLEIGATVSLQKLLDIELPDAFHRAIRHETTYNIRQVATLAGRLVGSDGRSPLASVMLALDAELELMPSEEIISLGSYLPMRKNRERNHLITRFTIPNHVELCYEFVARTPADLPIVCAAVACWPSGRTRVVLGGYGSAPLVAFDGPESSGVEAAARSAYQEAEDPWASAAFRSEIAGVLVSKCMKLSARKVEG